MLDHPLPIVHLHTHRRIILFVDSSSTLRILDHTARVLTVFDLVGGICRPLFLDRYLYVYMNDTISYITLHYDDDDGRREREGSALYSM